MVPELDDIVREVGLALHATAEGLVCRLTASGLALLTWAVDACPRFVRAEWRRLWHRKRPESGTTRYTMHYPPYSFPPFSASTKTGSGVFRYIIISMHMLLNELDRVKNILWSTHRIRSSHTVTVDVEAETVVQIWPIKSMGDKESRILMVMICGFLFGNVMNCMS
jgi:hypothetical protein